MNRHFIDTPLPLPDLRLVLLQAGHQSLFSNLDGAKESAPALTSLISQQEISTRLSRMSNSAPGKDRLEYKHIRQADGACRVTHSIFNRNTVWHQPGRKRQ